MKHQLLNSICVALIGIAAMSSQASAQQKTIKACEDEWRANKTENQAKGITEKAYVDQCRAGSASVKPTVPVAPAAAAKSPPPAQPAAAAPTATTPAVTAAPAAKSAPATKLAPSAATTPTGANQFAIEALAKARCPTDTVVWVNLTSGVYHFAASKDYGKTKSGAYMCEKDTGAANFRAAKNEKRPS